MLLVDISFSQDVSIVATNRPNARKIEHFPMIILLSLYGLKNVNGEYKESVRPISFIYMKVVERPEQK